MNLHALNAPPDPWLGAALEEFERQFEYPLGATGRFRIAHGREYLTFFQAMGAATVSVAERDGQVLGTLARVRRTLTLRAAGAPASDASIASAHYLCDLKVAPTQRGSTTLPRLIAAAKRQILASEIQSCYCVVMDGTGRLPTDYTGRLGVPRYELLGKIVVLRLTAAILPTAPAPTEPDATKGDLEAARKHIGVPGYFAGGGQSGLRSLMPARLLVGPDGDAVGTVEDTRRGKRLFLSSGEEMLSAHLSGFDFATPQSGARLLRRAVWVAWAAGLPALFAAVPNRSLPGLLPQLHGLRVVEAPASVYGHGLPAGHDWWIDPAEI
jgi:hypothetical protein